MEIRNLLVNEFKAVIIKMHTKLGRLMERHNVNFNKELEIQKEPTRAKELEKAMAPDSSTPVWKIPRMEEPGRPKSMVSLSDKTEQLHCHFSFSCTGEGNGNLLQCSCLENPRDGGAWWAAVYGVAQSRTRLKWLSSSRAKEYNNLNEKICQREPTTD